ncbi:NAD(P)H-hydrate dehydratase [Novosphingobium sp. KCTC 2891]|uniref:NAD(P)H-hydrate dehydratase n=1 Tax=Novosphingobium sp. KCTC 2891 TaxID=2989730 RepID=UPI0022216CBC|nr:NAD(P)H-hydrate dehydratase [Novosphingobium sp. KCTC 2891]MCW1384201.1 NAD(P)H-hydrate dehydratase [Novosphingobium sp. KCTC 2891]
MPRSRDVTLAQVLTVAQMRAAEEALIAGGTSVEALMEVAGRGAGEYVRRIAATRPVTVLCGPGNNGGDGYVIARHLMEHGNPVTVVAARDPGTPAAKNARSLFKGTVVGPDAELHGDVFVDCLFGSGLTRALPDDLMALLTGLAANHHLRVAVDLPSGVESDSGQPLNADLPASDLTIALGAWKHAHWTMPAAAQMGALRLVDIGVTLQPEAAALLQRPRFAAPAPDAHKYRRGLLAVVAGEMPGAPILSATAALRAGAGYVKLLLAGAPLLTPAPAEPVETRALPPELVAAHGDLAELLADPRLAALLVGPGLGRNETARQRLRAVMERAIPSVIDADALMLLGPDLPLKAPTVLTPHEGEMAALERAFGLSGDAPRRCRAAALAKASGAVIVLKGPDSLIAEPDGSVTLAPRASTWLSVAGTGDVLAGLIASRLATHADPARAAREGLWLHGEAARLCGPAFTAGELALAASRALAGALS